MQSLQNLLLRTLAKDGSSLQKIPSIHSPSTAITSLRFQGVLLKALTRTSRFFSTSSKSSTTKHIGIVACSAEGAALCYTTIAHEAAKQKDILLHPKVTMHSIHLSQWMPFFNNYDYKGVGQLMLESARILATAGAHFAICPDNSCHLSWEHFIEKSPIPWLHIAEVVAKEAKRNNFKKAALLGTKFTMTGPVYPNVFTKHQMGVVSPNAAEQQMVDDVIFDELVHGVFTEKSRLQYNRVIQRLKEEEGCDCVILGCTEIPLLVQPTDCPLPTLDSTRLLARAAVQHALNSNDT